MNLQNNILTKIFYTSLAALSLSACSDEAIFNQQYGEGHISFLVDDAYEACMSRSVAEEVVYPMYGMSVTGKDSLYFHTDVSNTHTLRDNDETRGVIINSANIDKEVGNIIIDAYVNGETPYIIKYPISKNGSIWSGADKRYWPSDKSEKLEFYASAMMPEGMNLTCSNGSITTTYTVPHSADPDIKNDAEAQPDILLGYSKCSYNDVAANHEGNVPMKLRHALAAVSFNVGDFRKGRIKTITIRNARKSGALTYSEIENDEISTPLMNWTLDEGLTNFTQTFDINVEDNEPTGITSQKPETTFMLLPQDIESDNVEFEIELECEENDNTVTKRLVASAYSAGNISQWEAGKHYTYTLSSSSINWTYVFELGQNSIILENGNQNGEVNLISYRYRTGNPQKKEEWPWKAEGGTANDATSTSVLNAGDWIEQLNKNGTGSISGETWKISVKPNRLINTDFDGDKILRNNPVRGTAESPWDLSTHKYGETSIETTISQSTANCYVVNSAGIYCFPAVYGNGYNGGNINTKALNKYSSITNGQPTISNVNDAILLWQDGLGLISDVIYNKTTKNIEFSIDRNHIQQGNAVIAVRNANQEILWSWHIWVYEKDLWKDTIELEDFDNSSVHYNLMNNNLGRCDAKTVYYDQREGNITFIQDGTGTKVNLSVILHEFNVETTDINSTLYQWGRKDPFTSVVNISKLISKEEAAKYKTLYPKGGEYLIKDAWTQKSKSMKESICNPHELYKDNNNSWMSSIISDAWSATKTIFDPCPMGFRVPEHEVFKIFCIDGENHTFNGDPKYKTDDNGNKVLDKNENPIIIGYTTLTTDVGKQRLNEYLNGEVISVENEDDVRHYNFYRVRNGKGDDDKFELISTGMRPFSGTSSNFNSLVLWSCNAVTADQDNALKNSAYAFKVGYEGEYLIQPTGSVIQANVYPIRPISENSTSGTNP